MPPAKAAPAQTPAAAAPLPAQQVPALVPIALSDVPQQAEAMAAVLLEIEGELAADPAMREITEELPGLAREIDMRLRESARIQAQRPSLELLRTLEQGWERMHDTLADWTRSLTRRVAAQERNARRLAESEPVWRETLRAARADGATAEVTSRIEALLGNIKRATAAVEAHGTQLVRLQSRIAVQDLRVTEMLVATRRARDTVIDRVFARDSAAIWAPGLLASGAESLARDGPESAANQAATLRAYAERRSDRFFIHGAILVLLAAALYWVRARVRKWAEKDPLMQRAELVFATPAATALVIALFASRWIYPQAPRLLWAVLGAAMLVPTILILRRLITGRLRPALYAVVVLYFIDQARAVVASLDVVPRFVFLFEMMGAVVFLVWFLRYFRGKPLDSAAERRFDRAVRTASRIALAFFAATGLANAFGYVTLANLLGNAALLSAYFGVVLYVLVAIADALVMMALRTRPLSLLGMVRRHPELLRSRVHFVLRWAAIVLWGMFALERLSVRERVLEGARAVIDAELTLGAISLSLGDVLAFAVTVWASILFSRLVQFTLDEDIYPRANLKRGLPYAISRTLHYLILVAGFLVAVAALGFDMTKFTILAGAFTVGVGFGLQNIFNNFVSGLILLFERPVQVGDVIQIDDMAGVVERIGIRASVMRTPNGSEVIVPNGKLISDRLINWTFSSHKRGVEIPVAVAHGADPERVVAVLKAAAIANPRVSREPPAQALLVRLGPDWLGFELHVWTEQVEDWLRLKSELALAVSAGLGAEKIALK